MWGLRNPAMSLNELYPLSPINDSNGTFAPSQILVKFCNNFKPPIGMGGKLIGNQMGK